MVAVASLHWRFNTRRGAATVRRVHTIVQLQGWCKRIETHLERPPKRRLDVELLVRAEVQLHIEIFEVFTAMAPVGGPCFALHHDGEHGSYLLRAELGGAAGRGVRQRCDHHREGAEAEQAGEYEPERPTICRKSARTETAEQN